MRVIAPRPALGLGAALAAAASLAVARPAAAQIVTPTQQSPAFTVRLGGYFTSDSNVRHSVGSSLYNVGLDYAVHEQPEVSRTIVSADYIDRSSGSNTLRFFPVTIGQLVLGSSSGGIRPYYGGGLGAYFIHQDFNRGSNSRNAHDSAVIGGYAAIGVEFSRTLDLEARYHLVTAVQGTNVSGLELNAGFRF